MDSFQDLITRVLNLESNKDFSDNAVAGGFNNLIPFIREKGKSSDFPMAALDLIIFAFNIYSKLSISNRKNVVIGLLKLVKSPSQDEIESFNTLVNTLMDKYPDTNDTEHLLQYQKYFSADIKKLWGIGSQNAKKFNKLGIQTIKDLLYFFPRKYQDYSQLKPIGQVAFGDEITIIGTLLSDPYTRPSKRRNLKITEAVVGDFSGNIRLIWFNRPYLNTLLRKDMIIVASGKVDQYLGKLIITNPEWELSEKEQINTKRIVPIYSLTAGITQRQIRKVINQNITSLTGIIYDFFPKSIIDREYLSKLGHAFQQIHFPDTFDLLDEARRRFCFEEMFFLQIGVMVQKTGWRSSTGKKYPMPTDILNQHIEMLPFKLTEAQLKAIGDVVEDLNSGLPMNRLIQGDVGSGKTVIARFAIEAVTLHGKQAALMAPTGILAEQHFRTMSDWLISSKILEKNEIALLVGGTPNKERKRILTDLENGTIKLIIGTHALLEDPVNFSSLQLVIIDEQHRFGVSQRNLLRQKGKDIHLLVMTATPIPRSLALTLYGDLDVSIIDEMPSGRQKVITSILPPNERGEAYQLINREIEKGNQVFIVYPKVESDDDEDYQSAVNEYERLKSDVFNDIPIGLLHGRLNPAEKDSIMLAFRNGEYKILVSTTVIEVGVDIPHATLVLVESANRFGLAQLHQIRGRVGRGSEQSFCFLIPEDDSASDNQRLQVMIRTTDGFELAEHDLQLRGPGEFIGTRQSGFSGLRLANFTDIKMIERTRMYAKELLSHDPLLENPQNAMIKEHLFWYWPELRYSMNMRGE